MICLLSPWWIFELFPNLLSWGWGRRAAGLHWPNRRSVLQGCYQGEGRGKKSPLLLCPPPAAAPGAVQVLRFPHPSLPSSELDLEILGRHLVWVWVW